MRLLGYNNQQSVVTPQHQLLKQRVKIDSVEEIDTKIQVRDQGSYEALTLLQME